MLEHASFQGIEIFYNGGPADCWQIDAIDPNEPDKQLVRVLDAPGLTVEVDVGPGVPVRILVLNNSGRAAEFRFASVMRDRDLKASRRFEDTDFTAFMYLCPEQSAELGERDAVVLSSSNGDPPCRITFSGTDA